MDVVIILRPYWRTTSVRESSCSLSPAHQSSLYTTSLMKSSSTSCITSTPMTPRFVRCLSEVLFCYRCMLIAVSLMPDCFTLSVQLTTENVFDVLCMADMYLLAGLKSLCGKTLAKTIGEDNVLYMWKTAKLFCLSRLEDYCTEFMAKNIERVSLSVVRVPRKSQLFYCVTIVLSQCVNQIFLIKSVNEQFAL